MNRLIAASISALFLASQSVPAMADQSDQVVRHHSWNERFTEERHGNPHEGDSRRNSDYNRGGQQQGYQSSDNNGATSGTGNLTVPLFAVAGAILVNALNKPRPVQNNVTISNSFNTTNTTTNTTTTTTNTNTNTSASLVNVPAYAGPPASSTLIPEHETHPAPQYVPPAPEPTAYQFHDPNDMSHYHDLDNNGPAERHGGNAPADMYFGHTQMSILGIRNSVNDIARNADGADENKANDLLHKLYFVEDAYRAWQAQYPGDTWLLQYGYGIVEDYAKLDAEMPNEVPHTAAIRGIDLGNWLDATYPGNPYSK